MVMNQITLQESEILPENSMLHDIDFKVAFGRVGLKLNDEEEHVYDSGSIVSIQAKTKINLSNQHKDESTVFLVKT